MAALLPITGTVSIGFDGMETHSAGAFSIPVRTTLDPETGFAHLDAAPHGSGFITAMVTALRGAANELLTTIPNAVAQTIAVCPTCDAELGVMNSSITIEHGRDGGHIEDHRY